MRIYLVGFMGSGKSTLGRRVAGIHDVPFFDTDQIIESQAGMSITEIFNTHGEDYFRHLETDVLRQTIFYPKSINATGGGLPCYDDNMAWMKQHGITVYLQWPDELIKKQLMHLRQSRPLLANLGEPETQLKIKDLLSTRKPIYEQSAITIEMKGIEEEDYILLEKACKYIW
jgi:shikimate kinase